MTAPRRKATGCETGCHSGQKTECAGCGREYVLADPAGWAAQNEVMLNSALIAENEVMRKALTAIAGKRGASQYRAQEALEEAEYIRTHAARKPYPKEVPYVP